MSAYEYDLFAIGAGSGGVRASRLSAGYGARVAVAEQGALGGTCVNTGCVPKKLMLYASCVAEEMRTAEQFAWTLGESSHDWTVFIERKNREIERLNAAYRDLLEQAGVTLFEERARILAPHTVQVGERTVTAQYVLVATGGHPRRPAIPGVELSITSDDAFFLGSRPGHVLIVGAGYVALEFAAIFRGFGSRVTVVHRGDNVLRGFDGDVRTATRDAYRDRGIDFRFSARVAAVEKTANGLRANLEDGSTVEADVVFFAIGREPNTRDLGLETVGVELNQAAAVVVDDFMQTTADGVYAIGDVTDRMNLTPIAIAEGAALARTLFGEGPARVDYSNVPSAVFGHPPVGAVGRTEEQARREIAQVDIYRTRFRPLKQALGDGGAATMMKLVVDRATDRVLGAHMVGPDAPEIIQGIAIALQCGATKAQFDATIGIHPTSAEEFVTMRESS